MMPAGEPIMVRESPTQRAQPPQRSYPAAKARGGETVLNPPLKRGFFVAGLAGAVALDGLIEDNSAAPGAQLMRSHVVCDDCQVIADPTRSLLHSRK